MDTYKDELKLELVERIKITKEVKQLLKKAKRKHKKQGRSVSMSKIVCNLIIKEYGVQEISKK